MNNCIIHNQPITHFCQSCSDIICDQCLKNSHSDKLHNIQSLQSAFNKRTTSIQTYLNTDIKTKRNNLLQQIYKINSKISEIQKNSKIIQNDVQIEIQGLIMRLDNAEASKVLKFQSEIKRLEHLVNIVDDIFYAFEQSVKVPEKFLLLYKQIKQRIINVDVYKIVSSLTGDHTELPQQFKAIQSQIIKSQQIQQQSQFITEVLLKLLQTYKSTLRAKQLSARQKQSEIIQQYFSINQKLISHNFSLSKSCYFCGQYLSLSSINTACSHNKPFKMGETRSTTFIEAPNEIRGTRRHHWVANNKQLKQHKQIENNKLHLILITMRKTLYQKSTTINQLFESEDKNKAGAVNQLVFSYILSNRLGLEEDQISVLIKNFQGSNGTIAYTKLNQIIKDKQYLDQPVSATSQEKLKETVVETKKKYAY